VPIVSVGMRIRPAVVGAIAVAAALLLSGCDVAESLVSKAEIDLALQELTSELEEVPSVTEVTTEATLTGELTSRSMSTNWSRRTS
jgi:hypothetical protein